MMMIPVILVFAVVVAFGSVLGVVSKYCCELDLCRLWCDFMIGVSYGGKVLCHCPGGHRDGVCFLFFGGFGFHAQVHVWR